MWVTAMMENVTRLFDAEHRLRPEAVRALSDADFDRLATAARNQETSAHPARILELLYHARPELLRTVVREVVDDRRLSAPYRALALSYLTRVEGPAAEPRVRILTADDEPAIQLTAIRELGTIGSADSLAELSRLVESPDGQVQRLARLSVALVAFRSDIPGFEPALPPRIPPDQVRWDEEIAIQPAPAAEVRRVIEQVDDRTYGSRPSVRGACEMRCGRLRWVLLPDESLVDSDGYRFPAGRQLAAILAQRAEVADVYATSLLALTWPDADAHQLGVFRLDGLPVSAGTWRADGSFQLNAVRDSPFAVEIAGRARADLQLTIARSGRGTEPGHPTAVAPLR
jgi:hypothetical protein